MTYTRADYRTDLEHKLLSLEDGGYGDFAYETTDEDLFLDLSVARLYPAIYKRVVESGLSLTSYGTQGFYSVTPVASLQRIFLIEDAAERTPLLGWQSSGLDVVNIDVRQGAGFTTISSVNIYSHAPFVLPSNDSDDVALGDEYKPLVVLGALIEALESRQDTGVRGDPPPTGNFTETQLLDRLIPRYDKMRDDLTMSLPAVRL